VHPSGAIGWGGRQRGELRLDGPRHGAVATDVGDLGLGRPLPSPRPRPVGIGGDLVEVAPRRDARDVPVHELRVAPAADRVVTPFDEQPIRDEAGGPVAGALVTVTFGGMYHETLSATTGSDGVALVLTNQAEKGKVKASACVAGVSHPTKFYMSQDNAQTCDDG
jgi:hypothetical protein